MGTNRQWGRFPDPETFTLQSLKDSGLAVTVECDGGCGHMRTLDLVAAIDKRGPLYSLWDRHPKCEAGCGSRSSYKARRKGAIWPTHLRVPDGEAPHLAIHHPYEAARKAERRLAEAHRFVLRFRTLRRKVRREAALTIERWGWGPEALAAAARELAKASEQQRDFAADVYVEVKRRLSTPPIDLQQPL